MTNFKLASGKAAENDRYGLPQPASAAGLKKVTAAVVAAANAKPGDRVVDLGCGSGQVALALAETGARVLAVDGNPAALGRLETVARSLPDLQVLVRPIDCLSLPAHSADLIVTSYAMHRLRHADKERLVSTSYYWLKPGGRLIVADMMFGRGGSRADRAIIRTKVRRLARRGLGGWWRIIKNGYKYLVRAQDHPASISAWTAMLAKAGFAQITATSIVNEAGLVTGRRPAGAPPEPSAS